MGMVFYNTNKGNAYFTWSKRARRNADWSDKHREQLLAKFSGGYVMVLNCQVIEWAKFMTWLPLNNNEDAVCCEIPYKKYYGKDVSKNNGTGNSLCKRIRRCVRNIKSFFGTPN